MLLNNIIFLIKFIFSDLIDNKGAVFDIGDLDPELSSGVQFEPENLENYFQNDFHIGDDTDEDEDGDDCGDRTFEELAAKMTNLTEDGGVKKKVYFSFLLLHLLKFLKNLPSESFSQIFGSNCTFYLLIC